MREPWKKCGRNKWDAVRQCHPMGCHMVMRSSRDLAQDPPPRLFIPSHRAWEDVLRQNMSLYIFWFLFVLMKSEAASPVNLGPACLSVDSCPTDVLHLCYVEHLINLIYSWVMMYSPLEIACHTAIWPLSSPEWHDAYHNDNKIIIC